MRSNPKTHVLCGLYVPKLDIQDAFHSMEPPMTTRFCALFFTISLFSLHVNHAETRIVVATFNLENYRSAPTGGRPAKTPEGRKAVLASLQAIAPDVLALQELGSPADLAELQSSLRSSGILLPHAEPVQGPDTNILLGILSRFPITHRRPHTNEQFLLDGRRHKVSRGFAEVEVSVSPSQRFTLLNAHLKSKRPVAAYDEQEVREQEALRLRGVLDKLLAKDPSLKLVVCGDFNDTPDSRSIQSILGSGRRRLFDPRPTEWNPALPLVSRPLPSSRPITWTHYYAKDETYSRLDYILLSTGIRHSWKLVDAFVLATPEWGNASDHRPVAIRMLLP